MKSSKPQTLWSRYVLSQRRWTGSVRRCWHLQEKKKRKPFQYTGQKPHKEQQNKHSVFTSMWEELGVYLLESFLIYDATWTLLERQRKRVRRRRRGRRKRGIEITDTDPRDASNRETDGVRWNELKDHKLIRHWVSVKPLCDSLFYSKIYIYQVV